MIATALVLLAGCKRPGDGREGGSDKQEWSILQNLEVMHRGESIKGIEFQKVNGYQIICVPSANDNTRIWIMADPKSPPFYKQLPSGSYWLTDADIHEIRSKANPTSTVLQVFESHKK
jgi:hypothetical protein